jgi:hypothetical protein
MAVNRWAVGIASCLVWSVIGVSSAAAGESDALIKLLIKKGLITEQELAQAEGELAAQQTQTAKPTTEAPRTLEERLAKLEKDVGDKSVIHVGQGTLKVGGLFQGWALWDGDDNDRFRVRRTEVKFSGDVLGDERFLYTLMVDPSQVTEDASSTRKSILQDFYFTLAQLPYLPHHAVQLGQFKLPSEEEGNRSSSKLDFAERSYIGRTFGDKRDIGAMLIGTWPLVDYAFGVFNGAGQNLSDTDDQKDLAAKVTLKPLEPWKDRNVGRLEFDLFGYHRPNHGTAAEKKRLGWGARYEWERLSLKSAYMLFQDGAAPGNGWYGQAGYFLIPKKLQALARFEGFDPNERLANDAERDLSLGLNYFIAQHNAKVQLNWVRKDEQGDEIGNDQLIGAFQYAF